jgi:transposase
MYIRKSTRTYKGKTYTNYLLVESVQTPNGPRQRTICSLGSREPGPVEEWLGLAHKLEAALRGQQSLPESSEEFQSWVKKARQRSNDGVRSDEGRFGSTVTVATDNVDVEHAREAGPVHVGHQFWSQLGMNQILESAGLSQRACILTEVMTLNRLIAPSSEHAMPDWIRRTALGDILKQDFSKLEDEALYRNLDRLHPNREHIERKLADKEKTLFNLDDTVYLYDLTSTYFEGQAKANPQAKRGYSRDQRPDCKQVVVGLVLDRDGFPKAHEIFDGNMQDRRSLDQMLDTLEKRTGKRAGATVIVDRGMAFDENLQQIRQRGLHYIVAGLQAERNQWLQEFETADGWEAIHRTPSPRNPFQKKTHVEIKRQQKGDVTYILCRSEGREEKDRAIREKQEAKLIADLSKLHQRVAKGLLKDAIKIQRSIGRLQERYPRVARYYEISCDVDHKIVSWKELADRKAIANKLDGSYILKTDRQDLTADDIWRTYILLTRVEDAFRDIKSPLMERPIFHHLEHRTQTHIFLCVLAYHLLAAIEHRFLQAGVHTSWATVRDQLRTHQVITILLPQDKNGLILKIRKATIPEQEHRDIYATLGIPTEVIRPIQTWHLKEYSDEKNLKL